MRRRLSAGIVSPGFCSHLYVSEILTFLFYLDYRHLRNILSHSHRHIGHVSHALKLIPHHHYLPGFPVVQFFVYLHQIPYLMERILCGRSSVKFIAVHEGVFFHISGIFHSGYRDLRILVIFLLELLLGFSIRKVAAYVIRLSEERKSFLCRIVQRNVLRLLPFSLILLVGVVESAF